MNCDWCERSFNEKKSDGICPHCGGFHKISYGTEHANTPHVTHSQPQHTYRPQANTPEVSSKNFSVGIVIMIIMLVLSVAAFFLVLGDVFTKIPQAYPEPAYSQSQAVAENNSGVPSEYMRYTQVTAEVDENGVVIPMSDLSGVVLTIPEGAKHIPDEAFIDEYIFAVILPDSLETIGDYAFYDCYALEYAHLNEGLTTIGDYSFGSNSSDGYNVDWGTLPSTLVEVGDYAFSSWIEDSLSEEMSYYGWENHDIPADLKLGIGSFNFSNYPLGASQDGMIIVNDVLVKYVGSAKHVTIPDGVRIIDSFAFIENESVETVSMPNTVERIGERAFYKNDSLTTVVFSDNLKSISNEAFYGSDKLQAAHLPEGLISTGADIFVACDSLHDVYIPTTLTDVSADSFVYSAWYYDNYIGGWQQWIIGDSILVKYVVEYGEKTVYLPEGIKQIASDGAVFIAKEEPEEIVVPEGVTHIGEGAFSFIGQDDIIFDLPDSLVSVDGPLNTWLSRNMDVDVRCNPDTYAYEYALEQGYNIIPK